jgi:hypothetical protein
MRLRSKLLLAQLPLAVALVLVGYGSRRTIAAMDRSSQDILEDNYLSVLAAQHMRDAADALDRTPQPRRPVMNGPSCRTRWRSARASSSSSSSRRATSPRSVSAR